ncbi:MAG: hypothetical protein JWN99_535, partial [Ilumatobacteraceae bacterium]|nr:hypothetical protein [Ilumatobacteraceae bacterium]
MNPEPAIIDPGFSTAAMSACFSPAAHVRAMSDVQSALVSACADAGIEQREIADEIAMACAQAPIDAQQVLTDGWQVGTPVLALRSALREHLSTATADALDAGP